MTTDPTQTILSALEPFKNTKHGTNRYNTPWRVGADGGTLAVDVDSSYGLNLKWYDHKDNSAGNGWTLARYLGITLEGGAVDDTDAPYASLADYAHAHGVPLEVFHAAGWKQVIRAGQLAFAFTTTNGRRYRYANARAAKRKYDHDKGHTACWYKLEEAVALAQKHGTPLILCNGEASTIAAQYHDLSACCVTGGEKGSLPVHLLEQLKAAWQSAIWVAFDCDTTGRHASIALAGQLRASGFDARAIDLKGGNGFDVADFCRLHNSSSVEDFRALPPLGGVTVDHDTGEVLERMPTPTKPAELITAPSAPIDLNDLLAMEHKPTIWYAPGFLREGLGLLVGQPNVGKTPLAAQMAIAIATGGKWMGAVQTEQAKVLYLGMEYSAQELIPLFDISRCGTVVPRGQLLVKTIEDQFPTTAEEAIAELEWYIKVLGVKVIIIDVLTAFLPPEKFKQNIYRGDYSELKPYHRLALQYNVSILGVWHASKRESDPRLMYNGSTGMWAAAASRITMYQDQEQRVRIASFARMADKIDWALTQEKTFTGRRWIVADVNPEPAMSPTETQIYRFLKNNTDKSKMLGPSTIAEMTNIPLGSIKTLLLRMYERNIIQRGKDGYFVVADVAIVADVASVTSVADVAEQMSGYKATEKLQKRLHGSDAPESAKPATATTATTNDAATKDDPIWASVPHWQLSGLKIYLRSNIDKDLEHARDLCEQLGLDYDAARAAARAE